MDRFESLDTVYFMEHYESEDSSHSWNGLKEVVEKSIVSIGCLDELPLQRLYDAIIGRDHLEIDCHVVPHTGIIEPLCNPVPGEHAFG